MATEQQSGDTPAVEPEKAPATPAGDKQTPPQTTNEDNVTLTKKEHDELQRKAAQTSEAQSRADILQGQLNRKSKRKVEEPQPFETKEIAEVKSRVTSEILSNPVYAALTTNNPVLAKVLSQNPLQLVDTEEFVDVEDAVNQVFDYLDKLVEKTKPSTPPVMTESKTPPQPVNANPPEGSKAVDLETKENEELAKLPTMDRITRKLTSRIGVKS